MLVWWPRLAECYVNVKDSVTIRVADCECAGLRESIATVARVEVSAGGPNRNVVALAGSLGERLAC